MLGRRQVRLAAVGALNGAALTVNGVPVTVQSPGDWSVPPDVLPAVIVRTGNESKNSIVRGPPEYTTTCTLEVKAIVESATGAQAQDDIEALWYAIEETLLTDYSFTGMLQQVSGIDTVLEISAQGARHLGGIAGLFRCEYFEAFEWSEPDAGPPTPVPPWPNNPPLPVPLEEMGTHVDLTNVYDPSATYPNPPFPSSVVPAPRTQGPDGRDEGTLDNDLTGG
jgi:hypothetical protein